MTGISEHDTEGSFHYDPLPDPRTYIRLIKVLCGQLGELVSCNLSTWPLVTNPQFTAISYTWGDPSATTSIVINKRPMVVRRNCEYVLQQAWAVDPDQYLWVDAICIHQNCTDEKSHQVAMMGALYTRATRVLACVGEGHRSSEYLMDVMSYYRHYLEAAAETITVNSQESISNWTSRTASLKLSPWYRDVRTWFDLRRIRGRIIADLTRFLKRPYFSRLWIVQELYCGNGRITLCCGMRHEDLKMFLVLFLIADGWISHSGFLDKILFRIPWQSTTLFCMCTWKFESDLQAQRGLVLAGSLPGLPRTSLPQLLPFMSSFQCHMPCDKIYAIRSLVDWRGFEAPFPDYDASVFDLSITILTMIHTQIRWPTSDGTWAERSMLLGAETLREQLDLSILQPELRRAVDERKVPSILSHPNTPGSWHSKPRQGELCWWGAEIGTVYFHVSRLETHTILRCNRGEAAYAPPETQDGDWLITCFRQDYGLPHNLFLGDIRLDLGSDQLNQRALVIRIASDGKCSIIGPAFAFDDGRLRYSFLKSFFYSKVEREQYLKCFIFWWDVEDLLVLDWRYAEYDDQMDIESQLDVCFGMRIMRNPGSTTVQGPFSAKEIVEALKKDPKDIFLEPGFEAQESRDP
jgi:hypothetical protein